MRSIVPWIDCGSITSISFNYTTSSIRSSGIPPWGLMVHCGPRSKRAMKDLVRAIGVTGHGTPIAAMHRRSLERFDFDSVLLPYSWIVMQDEKYARDFEALLTMCAERGVAVQTIKSIASRPWGDAAHTHATWYTPLERQDDIDWAVHWVLRRPGVFLNTAGDITLLPKVLDAASRS